MRFKLDKRGNEYGLMHGDEDGKMHKGRTYFVHCYYPELEQSSYRTIIIYSRCPVNSYCKNELKKIEVLAMLKNG